MADAHEVFGFNCSKSDEGDGDDWPDLRKRMLAADIGVIGTHTWRGCRKRSNIPGSKMGGNATPWRCRLSSSVRCLP